MTNYTPSPTQTRPLDGARTVYWIASEASVIGHFMIVNNDDAAGEHPLCVNANATAVVDENGLVGLLVSGAEHRVTGVISANEPVTVVIEGPVYLGEIGLTPGATYYLATSDGLITDTAPTHTHAVLLAQTSSKGIVIQVPDTDYM